MKTIYFIFLSLMLFACSTSVDETGGEMKEFNTDAAPTEDSTTTNGLSNQLRDSLSDYFSSGVLDQLDQYVTDYNTMTTAEQFEKNYQDGMMLFDVMYNDLQNPTTEYMLSVSAKFEYWSALEVLDELQQFNERLGAIEISCAAECSEIQFLYFLDPLYEKAKLTNGKGDDDFMNLLISIEGTYGYAGYPGFKSWFNQTWDLGGSSEIGNGVLLDCILLCQDFEKKYPDLFENEILKIRNDFSNALAYDSSFMLSQEKVLSEYDKIFDLNFFDDSALIEIKKHYGEIQAGGESFEFDCETNDCIYG